MRPARSHKNEYMPEITKTVLVEHTQEQMFELVDAVERYPEFLPWC